MEPIIFQIIDWGQYNEDEIAEYSDELEEELGIEKEEFTRYKIRLYGRTQDNKSIVVNVNNYTPFFYVKIPTEWTMTKIMGLIGYIKLKISNPKILKGFKTFEIANSKDLYGFSGYSDFKFIRLIFHNMRSYKSFEYWIERNKINLNSLSKYPIKLKIYESNIEPFIRCMHIRKLNACGWVKISLYETYEELYTHCDIGIKTDWKNLETYDSNKIQKFIIASWDIECMSMSGNFPQAIDPNDNKELTDNTKPGDPIIQIGTVFSYYGESEPFYKNIITLGGCDKIKGLEDVDIQSYNNEKEVLLAWTKLIQKNDPDIITGWNINGFDFQYIYDRARKLKILNKFSLLSRIIGDESEFKEKNLSSSALGDNLLKYFDMGGRIIIDLMKVQQRDAKLDSYKLDFVASTYIKEKIVMCQIKENYTYIYTNGIYGIKNDDFINITWDDGLSENKHDNKYKINKLEKITEEELNILINKIEQYPNFMNYKFKKPKSLFKLKINGLIPLEIFEEGNEELWHNIKKDNNIFYFQFEGHNENHENHENHENNDIKLIDRENKEIKRPIKGNKVFWAHAKDDITPKELFSRYRGSDSDRGIIAKYCIMDCILVTKLMEKLQVLNNNIGMSNVCSVPLNYIFMRGQGVKIFSLVSKKCRELNFLIPKLKVNNKSNKISQTNDINNPDKFTKIKNKDDSDDEDNEEKVGYEGATVFTPDKGIHFEPIPVLDYASLYPRSMIYINISHECYVNDPKYDNLPGYTYETVTYEVTSNNNKTTTTCRFAKKIDGTKGVLCLILEELLKKRSSTKKQMEKASELGNHFEAAIYDGLQLAYKVTANSLYGQVGAATSPIYMKELAASTTATGRKMLEFSRDFIEGPFGNLINLAIHDKEKYYKYSTELYTGLCKEFINNNEYLNVYKPSNPEKFKEIKFKRNTMDDFINYFYDKINSLLSNKYKVKPKVIYGDTDSVFFSPKIHDIDTKEIKTDRASLKVCIEIGMLAGDTICKILPEPEEQVYEKTLWPFIILTKKRYVGNLYEESDKHYKQKSMGIVLKRRDNAKIVKIVVGGIVDYILNGKIGETSINDRNTGAIEYTKLLLKKILRGEYSIDKYIVSKTLRSNYADRTRIAHAYLADKIGIRDPGNKPDVNDRIPYVYIIPTGKVNLQGERVEDPKYVIANNLELDYLFYITNQIMKPSIQFLEHIANNPEKLFENYILKEINRRKKINPIMNYISNNNQKQINESNEDSDHYEDKNDIIILKNNNILNKSNVILKNKNKSKNNSEEDDLSDDRILKKILSRNIKTSFTIDI